MKRVVSILILLLITSMFVCMYNVYAGAADDVTGIIGSMTGANDMPSDKGTGGISGAINDVIGLLQIAGTGIALIVVTMLGIKYMLASPSDKAEVKKQIMPILIGCFLIFGAVMIVTAMIDIAAVVEDGAGN